MADVTIKEEELAALRADQAKKAELEAANADLASKLSKLENKEFNFKRLRDMTQEEMDKLTDIEVDLKRKQEKLEEDQLTFKQQTIKATKDEVIERLANGDEELKKRIEAEYDGFKGDAEDKRSIVARAQKAAALAKSAGPDVSPVGSAFGLQGEAPRKEEKKDFAETDEGKGLADALGLNFVKAK